MIVKEFVICIIFICVLNVSKGEQSVDELLSSFNKDARQHRYMSSQASWVYNTNITNENSKTMVEASLTYSQYLSKVRVNASKVNLTSASSDAKRQISLILSSATSKNETVVRMVADAKAKLKGMYGQGCVMAESSQVPTLNRTWSGKQCINLDPDLYTILSKSRNRDELLFAWKGWRDATGPSMKSVYTEFVDALNKGARENHWKDYGEYVRSWYEVGDQLGPIAEKLWLDLQPFYEELHAYVRFKLSQKYKDVKDGEPIPAHLLGNMWAQDWTNIYDLVAPFPGQMH